MVQALDRCELEDELLDKVRKEGIAALQEERKRTTEMRQRAEATEAQLAAQSGAGAASGRADRIRRRAD